MNDMLILSSIASLSFSSEIEKLDLLVTTDSDTDTSEFASEKLDWSTPISLFPTGSDPFQPPKYLFNHTSSLDCPVITVIKNKVNRELVPIQTRTETKVMINVQHISKHKRVFTLIV